MEQENIPPQNYEWQISTPPDEGEMFDSNALYSIPEFLRILRVIMNRHFDDPELGGMIEVMEIWEKKVLDLMGNDDGGSKWGENFEGVELDPVSSLTPSF